MSYALKVISFLFHPLIMPLIGVIFYFSKAPRHIPEPVIKAKLISLTILTVILPILLYSLLKTIKKVESIYLEDVKHRIIPLVINSFITILILIRVLPASEFIELYYFFVGIIFSNLACLILAILKFKASIHMIALGGILMFFIALSIHFSINIIGSIALIVLITGAVATSRLHLHAHTMIEVIFGFFIGLIPQLIVLNHWL